MQKPSLKLPPILARLQEPSPSFGSLAPSARVKRRNHNLPSAIVADARTDQRRNDKLLRNHKITKVSSDCQSKQPSYSLPSLTANVDCFDDVMSAAKRAVAKKKMAVRWSPEAVMNRVENTRRERLQHIREREEEVEVRFMKNVSRATILPPLVQPDVEHDCNSGDASTKSEASSPSPARRRGSLCSAATSAPSPARRRGSSCSVATVRTKANVLRESIISSIGTGEPPVTSGPNVALSVLQKRFARLWLEMDDPYGYSAKDAMPLFNVYTRSIYEGDTELHKDELPTVAEILGHSHDEMAIAHIANEISSSSTLSFDEFLRFDRNLSKHERESWKNAFEKYDADKSGQISVNELKAVLQDLGWTPWRQVLQESMEAVDSDGNGQMDFAEFKKLMLTLRRTEGFSKQELAELRELYKRFDRNGDGELDPDEQVRMKRYLGHGGGSDIGETVHLRKLPVGWQSFLSDIRRCRENEINVYREKFAEHDGDGSGELCLTELPSFFESIGILPLKWRLRECIKEVDTDCSGAIDFEELVHMMWLYRRTEGFTIEEAADLEEVFKMFDDDNSGEISTLELGNILRHEGYIHDLLELQRLSAQYDVDGTGEIGLREFLKLMRAFREDQVKQFWKMFKQHDADNSGTMSTQEVGAVLRSLGHEVSLPMVQEAVASVDVDNSGEVDWDEFVDLMERYRRLGLREKRRRCGFSDEQLRKYHEAFLAYDINKNGDIGPGELMRLLEDLNLQPRTESERQRILSMLDRCRAMAEEPSEKITYWVYLRLLRILEDDQDRGSLAVERQAAEKARFSKDEVIEFREIFVSWYDLLNSLGEDSGAAKDVRALTADGIARILRSLGVRVSSRTDLDRLGVLTRECDQDGNGKVDFPDFLMLMRRLMDENFKHINEVIGAHHCR